LVIWPTLLIDLFDEPLLARGRTLFKTSLKLAANFVQGNKRAG